MPQAWVTWDVRITSKVLARDNAQKAVLAALPKEVAENTDQVHVGQGWENQLKRELQLIRHFIVQSACISRFPKICTLVTDLHDRMDERRHKDNIELRKLAELAFQGVDSPYLDLFARVPGDYIANGRLQWRGRPLWKASAVELLRDRDDDR